MTTRPRKKRPRKPADIGEERRRWWRNLPVPPLRQQWTGEQRDQKLRSRNTRIAWGKVLAVAGSFALTAVDSRTEIGRMEIEQASIKQQIIYLDANLKRLESYWGIPAPRNAGQ
jgi:hypothetical protein